MYLVGVFSGNGAFVSPSLGVPLIQQAFFFRAWSVCVPVWRFPLDGTW